MNDEHMNTIAGVLSGEIAKVATKMVEERFEPVNVDDKAYLETLKDALRAVYLWKWGASNE
jgi:hypothetical protein